MTDTQFHVFITVLVVCSTLGVAAALLMGEIATRALDDMIARRRVNASKRAYRKSIQKTRPGGVR